VKELTYTDLTNFYLKSTVKGTSVVIHNPNVEPGSAEALSQLFGVEITPSDEVQIVVIKVDSLKKARFQCEQASQEYTHCAFDLWQKGRQIEGWPKK
jgi:hypothetical protein